MSPGSADSQILELAQTKGLGAALQVLDEEYASLRGKLLALIALDSREAADSPPTDSPPGERRFWPPRGTP